MRYHGGTASFAEGREAAPSLHSERPLHQRPRRPHLPAEDHGVSVERHGFPRGAAAGELHCIARYEAGLGDVAGADLIENYTLRMARRGVPARAIHDALKVLPRNNRCPLCNCGSVETLGHVLPKRIDPGFSVKPANLVGSCGRCNRLKHDVAPAGPDDGYLHPLFDCEEDTIRLKAEIARSAPAAATFRVGNSAALDSDLVSRVRTEFDGLQLARLYSDAAADEIVDIEHARHGIYRAHGADAVADHLAWPCESRRRANRTSWRAALYDALAQSDWYGNGGFRAESLAR